MEHQNHFNTVGCDLIVISLVKDIYEFNFKDNFKDNINIFTLMLIGTKKSDRGSFTKRSTSVQFFLSLNGPLFIIIGGK